MKYGKFEEFTSMTATSLRPNGLSENVAIQFRTDEMRPAGPGFFVIQLNAVIDHPDENYDEGWNELRHD